MAFVAKESSGKGKKSGEGLKKGKCYNCKKVGHYSKDCWAPGGGAEGKGLKQKEKGDKGKEKDVATKVEEKNNDDDGIWMALVDADEEILERVEDECEMWTTNEIFTESDVWAEDIYESLPDTTVDDIFDDVLTDFDDLGDSIDVESIEVDDETDDVMEEVKSESLSKKLAIDNGEEAKTYMFAAITLAGTDSTVKTELYLYDSGVSRHMLPYRHKFINFILSEKNCG
jgi:Zinc knuckle